MSGFCLWSSKAQPLYYQP